MQVVEIAAIPTVAAQFNGMEDMILSNVLVFVGSYAESDESGVEVFRFDEQSGQLTKTDEYIGLKNPTFLNANVANKQLYAISEMVNEDGSKSGEIVRFTVDLKQGKLAFAERMPTVKGTTCHIQRDQQDQYLTVTSYHGGMIGLIKLQPAGQLGEVLDVAQHSGSSVDPDRQDRPHPHSSFFSPDNAYLFVQDLGLDLIVGYKVDAEQGKLMKVSEVKLAGGAGPRHLTFHPSGKYAYVINELNSTVTSFTYDANKGTLQEIETISTLPADYNGENGCAEITVSNDGKFLYGSNRGHDSIVGYAIDEATGKLSVIQHISTAGGHPRHFALTPNGNHMLVANRDGNHIVTFKVDRATGLLHNTGIEAVSSKPVCVIPVLIQ